jgi:beta-lactamase regulating signal transducer with metallopeptidase domain
MLPVLLPVLANLGAGALLSWLALPLFARLVVLRFTHEPRSSHRALLLALLFASLMMAVPWFRALVHPAPPPALALGDELAPGAAGPPGLRASPDAPSLSTIGFYVLAALGASWLVVVTLSVTSTVISAVQLGVLLRRARRAPVLLTGALARAASRAGVTPPHLVLSEEISVPFAALPWSPLIALPDAFVSACDREQLDLALAHELAHVRRGDLWLSLLVRALDSLFTVHPTARRLVADLAFVREAAVDAEVSAAAPHAYASLLLDVAANARFDQLPRPVSLDDTALKRRIAMLSDSAPKRRRPLAPLALAAALLLSGAVAAPTAFATPAAPLPRRLDESLVLAPLPLLRLDELIADFWRSRGAAVRACFGRARAEEPELRVNTICTLALDDRGGVTAASVPIPHAPALQACIESAAASWRVVLPSPPPGLPPLPPPPLRFSLALPE